MLSALPGWLHAAYRFHPQGNKSAALNAALSELSDELVLFFDDDVRFSPQVLAAYYEAASTASARSYFGGPTAVDYEVVPPEWLRELLPLSAKGFSWSNGKFVDRPCFLGFNWAAFANDLKQHGGFRIEFGPADVERCPTGGETMMQIDLMHAGFRGVYVPQALVWHFVPAERCSPEWLLDRSYRNGIQLGLRGAADRLHPLWRMLYGQYSLTVQLLRVAMAAGTFSNQKLLKARARYHQIRGRLYGSRLSTRRSSMSQS
jgi:glycosyltransferase involved in cell wall biosynthesis